MKKSQFLAGKIINRYRISTKDINDLNKKYEEVKNNLASFGHRLAGRLNSELQFTGTLQSTNVYKKMCLCITNYFSDLTKLNILPQGHKDLTIISCWINDMVSGEYNPPHTHHNCTGWSTVLFLKVPEFIYDVKHPQKYKDGQLGFVHPSGISCQYFQPQVGDFYIFEASHQHCVMPFKTKIKGAIRISMSFNFILTDREEKNKDSYDHEVKTV